jgi:Domain of unknown function (DUF4439)
VTATLALQDCLAAEYAAVFGYGVLGGVLSASGGTADKTYAAASYAVHRARRDSLIDVVTRMGATPLAAEPAYALPFAVTDRGTCRELARRIEHRTASTYSFAVARSEGDLRSLVAGALTDAAVREVRWGGAATAFPGAADL